MSQNADYGQIETILMRADVYRTAYRRMSIIALALLVVAVIAVLAAVSLALTRPEPRYFATTADGCQSASKRDPLSASKKYPSFKLQRLARGAL